MLSPVHSYLNAFTGFLVAAFQLCQLNVTNAMINIVKLANTKTHQLSVVLYAKFSSHFCIAKQAIGEEIQKTTKTHFTKFLFSKIITSDI